MTKSLQNNRNNQTAITNVEKLKSIWLGVRDSNPRMPGPEPGALPLGQLPLFETNGRYCSNLSL
jgi:hypothetical protein